MIFQSRLLSDKGFAHAFPSRQESLLDLMQSLDVSQVEQVRQVHGAHAAEAPCLGGVEADAVVGRAGIGRVAVGVRVADCVPILVGHEYSGDVVAIHAGWRGVVSGVVRSGLDALARWPVVAAIGPCIGACCFDVGGDVADRIELATSASVVHRQPEGRVTVDLRLAVRLQLIGLGVQVEHVDDVAGCTRHQADRFHSFRRDGAMSGRMLAAIVTKG
ncbi:MAG: polyphenol oxidase family protein [Polyangiaceae bacterium]